VVEWLTLLIRISEVLVSYLGPETYYPGWGLDGFPVPPGKFQDSTLKLRHDQ
jgi:hypothetical protein